MSKIKTALVKCRWPNFPKGQFSYMVEVGERKFFFDISEEQFHQLLKELIFDEEKDIFFESDDEFDSDDDMLSGYLFMKYTGEMEEGVWDSFGIENLCGHVDAINHPEFFPALAEVFGLKEEDEKPGWEEDPDFWKK